MKILVVCQHFYPENFRINDICFELAKKGNDVTVLTGLPNYPKGKILNDYKWHKNRKQMINGVKVVRCSLVGRGNTTIKMMINYMWFAIFGSIKALFMKKDFDIVYVYQLSPITMAWPGIVVKEMKNIPLVIHCLDQWPVSVTAGPIKKNSFIFKILTKLSIFTYNEADVITISSKSFLKYFEKSLNILKKDKGLIYWPSYAESEYKLLGSINNKTFDLVFAGNIGPAQSVETIIEAANLIKDEKDIIFHIVGDGLSREKCEKLANEYKLKNVKFYGYHPVSEMDKYYKLADAFIITMLDNEIVNNTLPAKIQSYMLAGKPILGAVNGEVKDVIFEADCGLCSKSLDYKKLASNIIYARDNKQKLKLWGNNAYDYCIKHFDKDVCMNNFEEIIYNSIKNHNYYTQTKAMKFLKYVFSSGISMLVDLFIFSIFYYFIFDNLLVNNIAFISVIIARIISSFLNYKINEKFVFREKSKNSLIKYYILCFWNMIFSGVILEIITNNLCNKGVVFIKFCIDVGIFIINYLIQNSFIFKKEVKFK